MLKRCLERLKLSDECDNKYVMTMDLAGFAGVLGITSKPEPGARKFGIVEPVLEVIGMKPSWRTCVHKAVR
jgi:hypothetical protein